MRKHALIAAISLCALGGSLSAVNAAGPEQIAPAAMAVPIDNEAELPRFQPAVEAEPIEVAEVAAEPDVEEIAGGEASWYGAQFAGHPTANGERFNPGELTAAHRTLPFGSKVRVTHARSGKSVIVRINDRGPFAHNRIIDLSQAAAREIGIVSAGRGQVQLALLAS